MTAGRQADEIKGEYQDRIRTADTETARVKERTLDRLVEDGYSRASAELTTRTVMRDVRDRWNDLGGD